MYKTTLSHIVNTFYLFFLLGDDKSNEVNGFNFKILNEKHPKDQEKLTEFKQFLIDAFSCRENVIPSWNFDREGNLSFGVRDYTDFPGQKYDPDIGIFGMDINVVLERPGHRISRRRRAKSKIPIKHKVTADESRTWFIDNYNIKILEE